MNKAGVTFANRKEKKVKTVRLNLLIIITFMAVVFSADRFYLALQNPHVIKPAELCVSAPAYDHDQQPSLPVPQEKNDCEKESSEKETKNEKEKDADDITLMHFRNTSIGLHTFHSGLGAKECIVLLNVYLNIISPPPDFC